MAVTKTNMVSTFVTDNDDLDSLQYRFVRYKSTVDNTIRAIAATGGTGTHTAGLIDNIPEAATGASVRLIHGGYGKVKTNDRFSAGDLMVVATGGKVENLETGSGTTGEYLCGEAAETAVTGDIMSCLVYTQQIFGTMVPSA